VFSFVGSKKGGFHSGAAELNTEEIKKIMERDNDENRDKSSSDFIEGEEVCIVTGPFKSFTGTIEKVISKTNLLKVKVLIFGGETIIEVPFSQVKRKNNYE
jgi:transcriptional antiterminator NusG